MKKLSFLLLATCLSFIHAHAQSWDITGNAGTSPTVNFMGTLDDEDVVFKRHGVLSGLLDSTVSNTGWGVETLKSNTSGVGNNAFGFQALDSNTSGSQNVAIGSQALQFNTKGSGNVAIGDNALWKDNGTGVTGSYNTAVGYICLHANVTGVHNNAFGYQALSLSTSSENTAIGTQALLQTSSGGSNTALGNSAGATNTFGTRNTLLGCDADITNTSFTNAIAIGYNAKVGHSNSMILGGTGGSVVNVGVGTTIPDSSALLDLTSTNRGLLPPALH